MRTLLALPLASFLATTLPLPAAVVWATGSPGITTVAFSKPPSDNPALVTDPITPRVILGRADTLGLLNLASERVFQRNHSPDGTAWAFAGLNGNPAALGAANFASLSFTNWEDSLGSRGALLGNIVNRPGVVHLLEEDIYLDITFTAWGGPGTGGTFSYVRTSGPIPEPSGIALLGIATALLAARRRR